LLNPVVTQILKIDVQRNYVFTAEVKKGVYPALLLVILNTTYVQSHEQYTTCISVSLEDSVEECYKPDERVKKTLKIFRKRLLNVFLLLGIGHLSEIVVD